MASIEEAIFTVLKNDAGIASKVGYGTGKFHIYPFGVPEKQLKSGTSGSRYFIVYQKVSSKKITDVDIELPLIQINAIADSFSNAITLKDDIIRVLERFKGNMGAVKDVKFSSLEGETGLRDPDTDYFYIALSFRCKYFGDNV